MNCFKKIIFISLFSLVCCLNTKAQLRPAYMGLKGLTNTLNGQYISSTNGVGYGVLTLTNAISAQLNIKTTGNGFASLLTFFDDVNYYQLNFSTNGGMDLQNAQSGAGSLFTVSPVGDATVAGSLTVNGTATIADSQFSTMIGGFGAGIITPVWAFDVNNLISGSAGTWDFIVGGNSVLTIDSNGIFGPDDLSPFDVGSLSRPAFDIVSIGTLHARGTIQAKTNLISQSYNLQTTGNTVTSLAEIAMPAESAITLTVKVTAAQSTYANVNGYGITATAKNDGGTTALVSTITKWHEKEDQVGWECIIDIDNATDVIRVRVTGAAATTINWAAAVDATWVK